MYHQNDFDRAFLVSRNAQFRSQVDRRLSGALTEDEFRPFRLMNGLYLEMHAYMLRVAIPYGTLDSAAMRSLADVADRFDKGFGHFTTRQNIQFNWPRLRDVPEILDSLAGVGLHAIQSSGNTIRNVTADHFAGAAADEVADPRPVAELIRQWSTDHPEFQFLPRKFKIAVSGAASDRAATAVHDIGLRIVERNGAVGYRVLVGGGMGRTPMIGKVLADFLPETDLLPYLESVVAVWNAIGRRDNKYKARIKILVHEYGLDRLRESVDREFALRRPLFTGADTAQLASIREMFAPPAFKGGGGDVYRHAYKEDPVFRAWSDQNLALHRHPDYAIVTVSLKAPGATPGDATAAQMRVLADLAEAYGHDDLRVSHEQNVILPHVPRRHLPALHARLLAAGLGAANVGLVSDIIACPGMDYCSLATARSIPVAQRIALRFEELKLEYEIGPLKIKISGCINACGHHHVGHIGILGLERAGVETYQITLGGHAGTNAALGTRTGPGFSADEIVPAIERLVMAYLDLRRDADETFLAALHRLSDDPFRAALYPDRYVATTQVA